MTSSSKKRKFLDSRGMPDAIALGVFVLTAVYVTHSLWLEPGIRVSPLYQGDPAAFQWFLAHGARAITHLENPLLTTMLNAPDGVNMMANTTMLGLSVPLAPLTLTLGPHVSLLTVLTLGLAGTAAAWYYVLSRHLVKSRFAAGVGGWFCGFCPALVSHASWHPNIVFLVLVPFIVLQVLKLREPGRAWRNGVILAALVVYQAFIWEEIVLFAAVACGVFLFAYAVQEPAEFFRAWRPMIASLAVTTIVAGVILAYPLWMQFSGPHAYAGLDPTRKHVTQDLSSFWTFATESVAGTGLVAERTILVNESEEDTYFGWPLLAVALFVFIMLRRDPTARALRVTAIVFGVLALGGEVRYRAALTGIKTPWAALENLPLLHSVISARFGIVVSTVLGVLLAMATQRVWDRSARGRHQSRLRYLWVLVLAIVLVPVAPTPLDVSDQSPVPRFISDGTWRSYVEEGESIVPLPFPTSWRPAGMRWAAAVDLGFAIPGGYFRYPEGGIEGKPSSHGAPFRPTSALLDAVEATGVAPPIADADRRAAVADLQYWRAAIVVLPADEKNAEVLRATVEGLIGPARRSKDVWIWDVRGYRRNEQRVTRS